MTVKKESDIGEAEVRVRLVVVAGWTHIERFRIVNNGLYCCLLGREFSTIYLYSC